jgi:tRNA dimethylallyltransferase
LLDVAALDEPFDAARFARLAHDDVRDIQSRGFVPILCGGTGLYFKAFLEGLGDAPPANPKLRAELEAVPLATLLKELSERDPVTFAFIDRKNPRRVIRALEVIRLTGRPFSAQRANWSGSPTGGNFFFLGLSRESSDLHARIEARVDSMFEKGLVHEVGDLLKHGLGENRTAMQAIGYRQVVEHLRGERSLPDTIELVKIRTRQFAKRQMTWFRRHASVKWIHCAPDSTSESIAGKVLHAHQI